MDLSKLKVADLKKELKARGLSTLGTKNELMDRLQAADDEAGDNAALDNDDLLDEDAVLADETDEAILDETNANLIAHEDDAALLTPTTVTAPKTMVESNIPKTKEDISSPKKVVLNRNPSNVVKSLTVENSNPTENLKESDEDKEKKIVKLGSLSAEERAKLRAQKFGVPIPESIKKAERAERFGVAKNAPAASVNKTANTKEVDEKILKRQARFGIVTSDEIDVKKQKRAERFGAKTNTSSGVAVGANDEIKRKRAERFGL